ncbi:putative secondary metabolism biosynthetic enzyme [Gnomoniopsis sp. IMI 355080]|nr:putative secondary metabolism biosynthetic enzyme [Gnomoniopsis sp. IMI 355080]
MAPANPFLIRDIPKTRNEPAPLFLIHDASGLATSYFKLGCVGRKVYGISDPKFDHDGIGGWQSVNEIAEAYLRLIRRVTLRGDIVLGGWSFGGIIAIQIAHLLAKQGRGLRVSRIILIDSVYPRCQRPEARKGPPHRRHAPMLPGLNEDTLEKLLTALMRATCISDQWDPPLWAQRHVDVQCEPPINSLRFAPPHIYNQTFASRDATKPPAACIQFYADFAEAGAQSEDCLFVNVWAPANATTTSNIPVKVWLYGGGNNAGGISNATYDGCTASENIIQVSINYRLGPLGFLSIPELNITGNQGLQDQLLGLRWVQENISAFGGDPSHVLLFGQSAGARDVFVISSLAQAPSLISAAILQSPLPGNLPTLQSAEPKSRAFVLGLNCSITNITCVRNAAVSATSVSNDMSAMLGLVLDGTVVTAQPLDAGLKVPAIAGTTSNEGSLFIMAQYHEDILVLNATSYDQYLNATYGSLAQRVKQKYPLTKFENAFEAMSTVLSHSTFTCPTRRFLRQAVHNGVRVYTYMFNHTPTCPWFTSIPSSALSLLGSTHMAEIPFVFGGTENLPRPNGSCSLTTGEKALSAKMLAAWNTMAANANPGNSWPQYDTTGSMGINVIGDEFTVGVVDYSMCDFWDEISTALT